MRLALSRFALVAGLLTSAPPLSASAQSWDLFDGSKLLATGGVSQVEGAGGGGLANWALITGYGTRDGIGANVHYTTVLLPDYTLHSAGIAVGLFDRLELFPNAWQEFATRDVGAALGLIQQQMAPTQAPSEDMLTSGHAELELADGRWLRMTGNATSEGGSIIFLSDFTSIKDREESLRRAQREAEAANASKTRFFTNMSHELRTPLNAIIGFSEIISGQLFGKLGHERYLDYSYDILRSGRHLLSVINDVLDLSKSESNRLILESKPVDMRYVLKDCVAMMREQCSAAGHSLIAPIPDHEILRTGDAAKLRQIFLNLLSNAIKFTEPGGTTSLGIVETVDEVAVSVSDTGIGMDPEDVEVAFQPFAQVDNRLERRYEGTGLGLPLTKALVDLHRGVIGIDSARGQGTRITITFARAAPAQLLEAG